ncbi:hypothetical protein M408DRAFT_29897 [Serendipita vermifera MAFF 305830]|uniref:Uncharacterized protein n=1 Tax=Serendipita vermifera MAFF 305830 TaxID=933852 RepID=A0A0C3ALS9_SERVB|nr:hypothetical protein M408DRAFT_29897 [Serendipita vermifera MAFF 305830]
MSRSTKFIRRGLCVGCKDKCGAFIASPVPENSATCICDHPAAQHVPRYTQGFPGQPEKGGCKQNQCVGFGSPEENWTYHTTCDDCFATWLQHEHPDSPVKPSHSSHRPTFPHESPVATPRKISEKLTRNDEDRESVVDDKEAVPEPDVQLLSLDEFLSSRSSISGGMTPKMSHDDAYKIAKKRRLDGSATKRPTVVPLEQASRRKVSKSQQNSLEGQELADGSKKITILVLPLECSMETDSNRTSFASKFRLWITKFPQGYERLSRFGLLVRCQISNTLDGIELWNTLNDEFQSQMARAQITYTHRETHGDSSRFDPQSAAWSFVKVKRKSVGGCSISSSAQHLHGQNFNFGMLAHLSGTLDKELKHRLTEDDRPDLLLAAAFTHAPPSGRIPQHLIDISEFGETHTAECFLAHFFHGMCSDTDASDVAPLCTCQNKKKQKGRRRRFIHDTDGSENDAAPRTPISNTRQSITPQPRPLPIKGKRVIKERSPSPPILGLSSDEDVSPILHLGARPRMQNPFRRALSPFAPAGSSSIPSAQGRLVRSQILPPVQSPPDTTDWYRLTPEFDPPTELGATRALYDPTPSPIHSSPISNPAIDLTDSPFTDTDPIQGLKDKVDETVHNTRLAVTIMDLTGINVQVCAKSMFQFFTQHARARHIDGFVPNANGWNVQGASLGPANLIPLDVFRRLKPITVQSSPGPGPAREVARVLMKIACDQPEVCRDSLIADFMNLNLTSLSGASVERKIKFTTLGLCAAWHIIVTGMAPLPLSPLEIMVALQGTSSLLNEKLIYDCAPGVHKEFFHIWNSNDVAADRNIPQGHPLWVLIGDRLSDSTLNWGETRSQERHEELGALLISKMTNGNPTGCYGDSPEHADFLAFQAGLFVQLGGYSLREAWPTTRAGATNLVCALTPLPTRDSNSVLQKLSPQYSGSAYVRALEELFIKYLRAYIVGMPSHPQDDLFEEYTQHPDYPTVQRDHSYRARCFLYQMAGMEFIPQGSNSRLEITFWNHLEDAITGSSSRQDLDVLRFQTCSQKMTVYLTPRLAAMLQDDEDLDKPVSRLTIWLHSQIASHDRYQFEGYHPNVTLSASIPVAVAPVASTSTSASTAPQLAFVDATSSSSTAYQNSMESPPAQSYPPPGPSSPTIPSRSDQGAISHSSSHDNMINTDSAIKSKPVTSVSHHQHTTDPSFAFAGPTVW